MAPDLKIEIFAYNLFHVLWCIAGKKKIETNILEIYGDECSEDNDYKEVCDEIFLYIIPSRHRLFGNIYIREFTDEKVNSLKSLLDCYEFVISTCDRDDLFGHLTIFQKMFATLSFVIFMCIRIREKSANVIDVEKYGHIFWAMYFDKFTDEFYENGGWSKLKAEAKPYEYLSEFAFEFYNGTLFELKTIKEASINYRHFKNVFDRHERIQNNTTRISMLWIKFQIEHYENYTKLPLSYVSSIDAYEVELILGDLKLIFDPFRCSTDDIKMSKEKNRGSTSSTITSYSKIPCASSEMKGNDDAQIQQLLFGQDSRVTDKVPEVFTNISAGLENQPRSKCLASETEELSLNIIEKRENFELGGGYPSIKELSRQEGTVDSTKNSHIEQNILPAVNMKRQSETSSKNLSIFYDSDNSCRSISYKSKNEDSTIADFYEDIKEHDKIANADPVISVNQMEEIECRRKTSLKNRVKSKDLTFETVSVNNGNEIGITKEKMKMSFYLSSKEQSEIAKTTDVSAGSQMGAFELDGKITTENLPALQDFSSTNVNVISDDERKISKAREELKNEQKDPEVKNFLKMILVLNDKEGTKFVLSTLRSNEEGLRSSRGSSNKRKSRSKKKMSRK